MQLEYFPLTPVESRRGSENHRNVQSKALVSLGTVLIDCFQESEGVREEIGGGGLYAIIGARIWLPARKLAIGIDRGVDDFPPKFDKLLEHFDSPKDTSGRRGMWYFHKGQDRRTLKASIGYKGDVRSFEYMSAPPHRTLYEVQDTPLATPSYLHLVASPEHTMEIVHQAKEMGWPSTKLVLEPHPKHCSPKDMQTLKGALRYLDVLSPNHNELLSLFDIPATTMTDPSKTITTVEKMIQTLLEIGVGPDGRGIVVVRSGRLGACVGTKADGLRWVPAYFDEKNQHRVVDVTGAGNAFLGGFVAGLAATDGDSVAAALYGSVSASFILQQAGLPHLDFEPALSPEHISPMPTPPRSENGDWAEELWNDDRPHERLEQLRARFLSQH